MHVYTREKDFKGLLIIWLLHYNVTIFASGMLINWQRNNKGGINCKFLFETCTLLEQCTYLGYLLLEAPCEYVQHVPLLSINWLRLCPQSGVCVRSHAVRRRLFIVLMTAAHISPNVFSLWNFLGNIHVLFSLYIHHHSYLLYITFKQAFISFYYMIITLSFLRLFMAGRLSSVSCVRYIKYLQISIIVRVIFTKFRWSRA